LSRVLGDNVIKDASLIQIEEGGDMRGQLPKGVTGVQKMVKDTRSLARRRD